MITNVPTLLIISWWKRSFCLTGAFVIEHNYRVCVYVCVCVYSKHYGALDLIRMLDGRSSTVDDRLSADMGRVFGVPDKKLRSRLVLPKGAFV